MTQINQPAVDVIIVGSGFAGLGMAIKLKQEGRRSFVLLEKEADLGGTWYVNNYPGCACDVQSHLYSFSFEQNPGWSRSFSPQQEIHAYLEHCADKYDVRRHMHFNAEVTRARYLDEQHLWEVSTADGQVRHARALVLGTGGLSRPALPDIPGLKDFKGKMFHSQQWDHDYDLSGKKVAVVGTGASAIQFVPEIAPQVAQLDLYQRTPPWIMPKPDHPMESRTQTLLRKVPGAQSAYRNGIYWMLEARAAGFTGGPKLMKLMEPMARSFIERKISDPVLRAKVTPSYTLGCKRILLSNNYYPALTRDNVDVITSGIERITANGVVDRDGQARDVDAIILGTGFAATAPLPPGMILGRDGLDIIEAWKDTGPQAYLGTSVAGFPNMFIMTGPNTGLGHSSMVFMIESQLAYVMSALKAMDRQGLLEVDVRPEVQARFNDKLQRKMAGTVWSQGGCNSWYMDANGRNPTLWPYFTWQYRLATRKFVSTQYQLVRARGDAPVWPQLEEMAA